MFNMTLNNGTNLSFPLNFNFHFNKNSEIKESKGESVIPLIVPEPQKRKYSDFKAPMPSREIYMVREIATDINVYLFIEKEINNCAWNLVAPIILEKETGKIYQYELRDFTLEGNQGLRNIDPLIGELMKLTRKGLKVNFLPKVIDNELIHGFEYADSGITLNDLIEKSTDLVNYRNAAFKNVYENYIRIMKKYKEV